LTGKESFPPRGRKGGEEELDFLAQNLGELWPKGGVHFFYEREGAGLLRVRIDQEKKSDPPTGTSERYAGFGRLGRY